MTDIVALWSALAAHSPALAYIGPGAGIGLVYSLVLIIGLALSVAMIVLFFPILAAASAVRGLVRPRRRARFRRAVILGMDGLDPKVLDELVVRGEMPNFKSLAQNGCLGPLKTTTPPISPSAWSTFATGLDASGHGIYDFVRPAADYSLRLSSSEVVPAGKSLRIGPWRIPLGSPSVRQMRKGRSFWRVLADSGLSSVVLRVPATFPPEPLRGAMLSGMCVPDLLGTQGTYTRFAKKDSRDVTGGGRLVALAYERGVAHAAIAGPPHPFRTDGRVLSLPLRLRHRKDGSTVIRLPGQSIRLSPGQWSPWVTLAFRAGLLTVRGQAQFHLTSGPPEVRLYMSPIHMSPRSTALPISHPHIFADYISRRCGSYGTLGLMEDTSALSDGVLKAGAFLQQAWRMLDERKRMLLLALRQSKAAVVACVFDTPDRVSHMFWREHRSDACPSDPVADVYRRMDALLAEVRAELDGRTLLIVLSDHGFTDFGREVNLNTWLLDSGYLNLKPGAPADGLSLADVDWVRTRAFACGLAGLFINRVGRYSQGTVPEDEAPDLAKELASRLEALKDPPHSGRPVRKAFICDSAFVGPYRHDGPDIIVGYESGYRCSWSCASGGISKEVFSDNVRQWSGDHCVHPDVVPGVLACSHRLSAGGASMVDIAPTVLAALGVRQPAAMPGRSLLEATA